MKATSFIQMRIREDVKVKFVEAAKRENLKLTAWLIKAGLKQAIKQVRKT